MTSLKDVLCNLIYDTDEFCSLCFEGVGENAIRLQDEVWVEGERNTRELHTIISFILGSEVLEYMSLAEPVCQKCIEASINSFKFIKMCKVNSNSLHTLLESLASCIESSDEDIDFYKTVIFSINSNDTTNTQYYDVKRYTRMNSILHKFLYKNQFINKPFAKKKTVNTPAKILENRGTEKSYHVITTEAGIKKFQCNACSTTFTTVGSADRHYVNFHVPNPKSRSEIRAETKRKICNILIEDGTETYQCKVCETLFTKYGSLQRHYAKFHVEQTSQLKEQNADIEDIDNDCNIFPRIEEAQGNFSDTQMNSCDDDDDYEPDFFKLEEVDEHGKYQCDKCLKCFTSYAKFRFHYTKHGGSKPVKQDRSLSNGTVCSVCGKKFKSKYILKIHETRHAPVGVTCPICNKVYSNQGYLKVHICNPAGSRRSLPKIFTCDICKRSFGRKPSLRCHIRYRHLNTDHVCQWCGKNCGTAGMLREHLVVHTKEKNFKCDECGGLFVSKSALKTHTRIHTGERPYPCQYCELRFLSASRRSEHVHRKHSEPSAECEICHKTFRIPALRRHRRRHNNPNSSLYVSKEFSNDDDYAVVEEEVK